MPFTAAELAIAGESSIDHNLKTKLTDQVNTERPLLKKLKAKQKTWGGGKENVTEGLRVSNGANFQWYIGSQIVSYNKRDNVKRVKFPYRSAHDGFSLDEDRLIQNGIQLDENGKGKNYSDAEKVQLSNLLDEEVDALSLGFDEKFDQSLHLDGSQDADALVGLDAIISLTPSTGTIGGIDASTKVYWRNHAATGLTTTTTTGTIVDKMEAAWKACIRNGGMPDFILAGTDFIDGYRKFMMTTYGRVNYGAQETKSVDGGSGMNGVDTGLRFNNVPIIWDPVFQELDTIYAPATPWEKRCYFINTKHLCLRPIEGHDMKTRKPPRVYNQYEQYWGLTWKGALTTNRRNAHAVLAIA